MKPKYPFRWAVVALLSLPFVVAGGVYINNYLYLSRMMDEMSATALNELNDPEAGRLRNLELSSENGTVAYRLSCCIGEAARHGFKEVLDLFIYEKWRLALCGEINGKNSFGAYVGYRRFYVGSIPDKKTDKLKFVAFIDENKPGFATRTCEIFKDQVVLRDEGSK